MDSCFPPPPTEELYVTYCCKQLMGMTTIDEKFTHVPFLYCANDLIIWTGVFFFLFSLGVLIWHYRLTDAIKQFKGLSLRQIKSKWKVNAASWYIVNYMRSWCFLAIRIETYQRKPFSVKLKTFFRYLWPKVLVKPPRGFHLILFL